MLSNCMNKVESQTAVGVKERNKTKNAGQCDDEDRLAGVRRIGTAGKDVFAVSAGNSVLEE